MHETTKRRIILIYIDRANREKHKPCSIYKNLQSQIKSHHLQPTQLFISPFNKKGWEKAVTIEALWGEAACENLIPHLGANYCLDFSWHLKSILQPNWYFSYHVVKHPESLALPFLAILVAWNCLLAFLCPPPSLTATPPCKPSWLMPSPTSNPSPFSTPTQLCPRLFSYFLWCLTSANLTFYIKNMSYLSF